MKLTVVFAFCDLLRRVILQNNANDHLKFLL